MKIYFLFVALLVGGILCGQGRSDLGNKDMYARVNAGIGANFSLFQNGGVNLSLFVGTTARFYNATGGANLSVTGYYRGTGTSIPSRFLFTFNLSPAITFGSGFGMPRTLNTFNSYAGSAMFTNYAHSISFGQNFTLSSGKTSLPGYGRNQRTCYVGFTVFDFFTIGHYNDVQKLIFYGDGKDEFWSAGINISLGYKGYLLAWNTDMYYGKSNENARYADDDIIDGINYDRQSEFDKSLNNAQENINLTFPTGFFEGPSSVMVGLGRSGRAAMWPSDRMHDHQKDPDDPTKHFHHLYVNHTTTPSLRFQVSN
jgi:hypothetical protein